MRLQSPRGVKNRDPQHWRDSQQMEHVLSKYIISDKSVTEEEWARERAKVIDAEPAFGDGREENHLAAATELLAHQSSTHGPDTEVQDQSLHRSHRACNTRPVHTDRFFCNGPRLL